MSALSAAQQEIRFPPEFFSYQSGKAICKAGAYAEDLFEVKRLGVLRARGLVLDPVRHPATATPAAAAPRN
ncbi:MAG TPA: hypothetical protein VJ801_05885 [Polyangia bacterium]|nr:hypothetical protein [Polyangia bacterium]